MMNDNAVTGIKGENLAADFLLKKGFEIVAQNYRYKHAEIDLIVRTSNLVVFVEVKTRRNTSFGEPESFVNSKKAAKIFEGAEQFMLENNWNGNIRFDIVSVTLEKEPVVVHFEDAFH